MKESNVSVKVRGIEGKEKLRVMIQRLKLLRGYSIHDEKYLGDTTRTDVRRGHVHACYHKERDDV